MASDPPNRTLENAHLEQPRQIKVPKGIDTRDSIGPYHNVHSLSQRPWRPSWERMGGEDLHTLDL